MEKKNKEKRERKPINKKKIMQSIILIVLIAIMALSGVVSLIAMLIRQG